MRMHIGWGQLDLRFGSRRCEKRRGGLQASYSLFLSSWSMVDKRLRRVGECSGMTGNDVSKGLEQPIVFTDSTHKQSLNDFEIDEAIVTDKHAYHSLSPRTKQTKRPTDPSSTSLSPLKLS